MKLRGWSVSVLMSLLAGAIVSCDGDGDEDPTGSGGSAARGGTGGMQPSSGGSSTTGGAPGGGGSSTTGGASGDGGLPNMGGASGASGAAGLAGAAGSPPSSGGAGAGGEGGWGGAAGHAGAAGGGPEPIRECSEICADDEDCYVAGGDAGYVCNSVTRRCENQDTCETARDCAFAMAPVLPCSSDAECSTLFSEVCVDAGRGRGVCATLAAAGCFLYTATLTLPRLGSEGTAEVCAQDHYRCERQQCVPGCTDDDYCSRLQIGRTCNTTTHQCECETDTDCDNANLGVSRCDPVTRRCECGSDADCAVPDGDLCVAGRCSCSSDSACSTGFSGTRAICG